MPTLDFNSQPLANMGNVTITGTLSTVTYGGDLTRQLLSEMRNYRRFQLNSTAVSGTGSNAVQIGGNGVSMNSGNGVTSYATASWAHAYGSLTRASGAGINFDTTLGMTGIGLFYQSSIATGFGARFIIGDTNNGGVPANNNTVPLTDRGFGFQIYGGSPPTINLFAHTGTTFLSSSPVPFTGTADLNKITHFWLRNNRSSNQIELYWAQPSTSNSLTPALPATPTYTLSAAVSGLSTGRYCTANIITNGVNDPGTSTGFVLGFDEMLFTYGI